MSGEAIEITEVEEDGGHRGHGSSKRSNATEGTEVVVSRWPRSPGLEPAVFSVTLLDGSAPAE